MNLHRALLGTGETTHTHHSVDSAQAFRQFSHVLASEGARPALAYLVSLSDYRFIGIFRFQDGNANAAIHYDRENPSVMSAQEVPDTATYCCYVRDSKGAFMTPNAMADPRLKNHPARESVLAYCGFPLLDPAGTLLGTLCHYDVVPRDPSQLDLHLLLQVSTALQQGHHVPPYPTR